MTSVSASVERLVVSLVRSFRGDLNSFHNLTSASEDDLYHQVCKAVPRSLPELKTVKGTLINDWYPRWKEQRRFASRALKDLSEGQKGTFAVQINI